MRFLLLILLAVALLFLFGCPWPGPEPKTVLTVATVPTSGEVFVDGGSWGNAPQSREVSMGTYMVTFGDVSGYVTPRWEEVIVSKGQKRVVTGVYESLSPVTGLRVLVVYETDDLDNMPPDVASLHTSKVLRDWLAKSCADEDGQPAFRFLDKDNDVSRLSREWRDLFNEALELPMPVLIATGPGGKFIGVLPSDVETMITLLTEYGDEDA